jgi:predicted RNA-binding protein YlqC (UPF0109 family)
MRATGNWSSIRVQFGMLHSLVTYPERLRFDSARLESAWYNSGMSADEAFLRHLLSGIVLQPEHMRLVRSVDARGILFRVSLAKSDIPLLIGKAGQSIHAVRE